MTPIEARNQLISTWTQFSCAKTTNKHGAVFLCFLIRFKHCQFRVIFFHCFHINMLLFMWLLFYYQVFSNIYCACFLSFIFCIEYRIYHLFFRLFRLFSKSSLRVIRAVLMDHGSPNTNCSLGPFSPCLIPTLYVKRRRMIIVVASHFDIYYYTIFDALVFM